MRTIKFRGRKSNGEWLYGDLVHRDGKVAIFPAGGYDSIDNYFVDPATVGQYTGLNDANGSEIHEGDICRLTNTYLGMNTKSTIEIAYEDWAFAGRWPEVESPTGYMHNPLWGYNFPVVLIEIIGNVHDGPELIQEVTE